MFNRARDPTTPLYRQYAFPLMWLFLFGVLLFFSKILAPFIGSALIAYLLAPAVRFLCQKKVVRWNLPRWVAVLILYVFLIGGIGLFGVFAVPKIGAELGKLAKDGEKFLASLTPEKIKELTRDAAAWLEESGLPIRIAVPGAPVADEDSPPGLVINVDETIHQSLADLARGLRQGLVSLVTVGPKFAVATFHKIFMTFLILMVAAFLLISPERPLNFLRQMFPARMQSVYDQFLKEADAGMAGVVRGQVLICLVNGVLTFIGLYFVLGVKFAVILSTVAGVMSLIPIFGSILSSVPIVAVALTDGLATGLGALGWIIGIHLLEANVLNPKIMGTAAKIHPGLVVFALVGGEAFFGVVGALFAVPITSLCLTIFKMFHRRAVEWNNADTLPAPSPPVATQEKRK